MRASQRRTVMEKVDLRVPKLDSGAAHGSTPINRVQSFTGERVALRYRAGRLTVTFQR
jgi:hypothetical protein